VGTAEPPPLPLPDKPSIAVLPFDNMSGDPADRAGRDLDDRGLGTR
jgi:TolB-like protein